MAKNRSRSSKKSAKKLERSPGPRTTGARAKKAAKKAGAVAAPTSVVVVNIIPKSLSNETNQDSEPMLAVNPSNPDHIVGTAFTPDPSGSGRAPYFMSSDGGMTWTLNAVVPGGNMTGDITVAFSGKNDRLFAGILRQDSPSSVDTRMAILRTNDFSSTAAMKVLNDRLKPDQPFTQAALVNGGPDAGKERLYVGNNDFGGGAASATLDMSLNAGATTPTITRVRLERRSTAAVGQDGPQVRPTIHPDGTVYVAFYGWRTGSGSWPANTFEVTADVVVLRDDAWGVGAAPFEKLVDPSDGVVGMRVARNQTFAFNRNGKSVNGQQRLGGALSIAVDPRPGQSGTVYLAWGDESAATGFTIHVRRSTDRGLTWSAIDLLTLSRSTNAALAVNANGDVGLLYQQLSGTGLEQRWITHFRRSNNGGAAWSDLILARTPASKPTKLFDPYLGDYDHLTAVGQRFYGIFSANNTPDPANFPSGVTFQRNHSLTTRKLLAIDGVTTVPPSIDPFFFRVG